MSKLEQEYNLTPDMVIAGEKIEFNPVDNPRKIKEPLYLAGLVDKVIGDAFEDLSESYRVNSELDNELTESREQLELAEATNRSLSAEAEVKKADEAKLKQAEDLLSDIESEFNQLKAQRDADAKLIAQLRSQLEDAENASSNNPELLDLRSQVADLTGQVATLNERDAQRDAEYQALADDVNTVLDALEEQFADLTVEE